MRVLVDANSLLRAVDQPALLGSAAASVMGDSGNPLLLSAVTFWEISIKVALKKLTLSSPFRPWINQAIADLGMSILPITVDHADAQIALPMHHRDPFDRLLVAQARIENLPIVSSDPVLERYGITRIWE
jgi:PIN domain nuclease of toxin-antitoxin system